MDNAKNSDVKRSSLKRVVSKTILFGALIFYFEAIAIELFILIVSNMQTYKKEVDHEADYVLSLIDQEYLEEVFQTTKAIYYSTDEEIRHDQFSDNYKDKIVPIIDDNFYATRKLLLLCRKSTGMENLLLTFYDKEKDRLVVVIDGNDKDKAFLPGQWISDENGSIDKIDRMDRIENARWYMSLGYGKVSGWNASDYHSIYDRDGNKIGFMCVTISVNALQRKIGMFLVMFIPLMLPVVIIATIVGNRVMDKIFLKNIHKLSKAAQTYSEKGYQSGTSRFEDLDIRTNDEFQDLWETMVGMEAEIAESMNQIKEATAKEERIATELDVGRSIQMGALPSKFPAFPEKTEIDMYASSTPAKEIGGDFYDFFLIDDDHLALTIADVSGKGVPAALYMMISKRILKIRAMNGGTPAEIMVFLNEKLCEDNSESMFVTVWLGILDLRTGALIAANAGHEYPFITDEAGNYHYVKDPHGLAAGGLKGIKYKDYSVVIPKGGKLFVYTDGVAEAQNKEDELFGLERIDECLNKYKDCNPRRLIEKMYEEIDIYEDGAEQFDDITMLCLHYKGK